MVAAPVADQSPAAMTFGLRAAEAGFSELAYRQQRTIRVEPGPDPAHGAGVIASSDWCAARRELASAWPWK
jgi:hypothetical protein